MQKNAPKMVENIFKHIYFETYLANIFFDIFCVFWNI